MNSGPRGSPCSLHLQSNKDMHLAIVNLCDGFRLYPAGQENIEYHILPLLSIRRMKQVFKGSMKDWRSNDSLVSFRRPCGYGAKWGSWVSDKGLMQGKSG